MVESLAVAVVTQPSHCDDPALSPTVTINSSLAVVDSTVLAPSLRNIQQRAVQSEEALESREVIKEH